ncbi:ABC transporter ATP-binding protein [Alcaligenaceae bacterium CGII-47]|nr:ABC transporter ATP-binding protein [Alcaligenaceae bacterium CGII-47]
MLEINNLSSGYGDIQVLSSISLSIQQGEIISIVGANGAGKSTLVRTIMGTLPAREGHVWLNGQDITKLPTHQIAKLGIAQVMEGRRLFNHMTVEDNLLIGGDILCDKQRSSENLTWVYSLFPKLESRRKQLARSFSGGEQQMLAIGRALMTGPKLLLLDEPSIGLAPIMVETVFEKLPEINARGITIFLVEQDVHRSLSIASRAYVLEHGQIVMSGTGAELLKDDRLRKAYLGI